MDDLWLDMDEEQDDPTYHVNKIIEDEDSEKEPERGNTSLENVCGSEHSRMTFGLRREKTTFGTIRV
jgi:hypothetical protein